jgi:hypothetical protein
MIRYLRFYFEPRHKDLSVLALQSWREYARDKPRSYNLNYCTQYQQAFISQYRHEHAMAKLAEAKQQ